jgi:hypothetical protein
MIGGRARICATSGAVALRPSRSDGLAGTIGAPAVDDRFHLGVVDALQVDRDAEVALRDLRRDSS